MRIPNGFIRDNDGVYRRGNFYIEGDIIKRSKKLNESRIVPVDDAKEIGDNYTTLGEAIRSILAFSNTIGEMPRTSNVYIDKVNGVFKVSDKLSDATYAIVTSSDNVYTLKTDDITDADDVDALRLTDKDKLPVEPKAEKKFPTKEVEEN